MAMVSADLTKAMAGLFQGFAYESVTITNSVVTLTSATYDPGTGSQCAKRVFITVETAQIRYNYDGSTPTSTEGHIANVGDILVLIGGTNITNFKAIRTGSTSGVLKVTYER